MHVMKNFKSIAVDTSADGLLFYFLKYKLENAPEQFNESPPSFRLLLWVA